MNACGRIPVVLTQQWHSCKSIFSVYQVSGQWDSLDEVVVTIPLKKMFTDSRLFTQVIQVGQASYAENFRGIYLKAKSASNLKVENVI